MAKISPAPCVFYSPAWKMGHCWKIRWIGSQVIGDSPLFHGRELPGKYVRVDPEEYLVYHFTPKSFVRCGPNGEVLNEFNTVGYVFGDLVGARKYCEWKVNQNREIGCVIYDGRWKIVDRVINPEYLQQVNRTNSPKRQLLWSIFFLISGSALIWLDARHSWMLLIGLLLGARLAVGGIVKLVQALMRLRESRVEKT
jgi:hypothetical protein